MFPILDVKDSGLGLQEYASVGNFSAYDFTCSLARCWSAQPCRVQVSALRDAGIDLGILDEEEGAPWSPLAICAALAQLRGWTRGGRPDVRGHRSAPSGFRDVRDGGRSFGGFEEAL